MSRPVLAATRTRIHAVHGTWLVVGAAVAWNLLSLRAETRGVSYLNDSSVHEQMVRFASHQLGAGHLPLTAWFPYLGLGSPQFLHYQSLPAILTGLIGRVVGPNEAFRWSLYVLLSLWPVSIYLSARLFGVTPWAAAASAAMSPFLVSATGVNYEEEAYVWLGYGLWAQLWASLTLPLAWGLSWRAIREGRNLFLAVLLASLTVAMHFQTGYLAIMPFLLWPLVASTPLVIRVRRAVALGCAVLLASAWVIVPLLEQRPWAATNEVLHTTAFVRGYGAGQVLSWLVSGQLLDLGRVPVVTLSAAVGLLLACLRCRRDDNSRALILIFVACVVLSFGRTTLGAVADAIPGSTDLFFRRFMMGIELAALLLAGTGAVWSLSRVRDGLEAIARRGPPWVKRLPRSGAAAGALVCGFGILLLAPAWTQLLSFDRRNTSAIAAQQQADRHQGAQLDRLLAVVQRYGGGRVYAGMPSNWGVHFTVGSVPVFKYLESRDVDEVGYTLRTASLMTGPEYYFDPDNPGDYSLFGVHYLILPFGRAPSIPARLTLCAGTYCLWRTLTGGYVHVGSVVGMYAANRSNLGTRSIPILHSRLALDGAYFRVLFSHSNLPRPSLPPFPPETVAGGVVKENNNLDRGEVTTTVKMRRSGVVVLSVSFDPGWRATVDGQPRTTQIVAPALVATAVPAGLHKVEFRYRGFENYLELFVLGAVSLLTVLVADLRRRAHRASAHHD